MNEIDTITGILPKEHVMVCVAVSTRAFLLRPFRRATTYLYTAQVHAN